VCVVGVVAVDKDGKSPLDYARQFNKLDAVKVLTIAESEGIEAAIREAEKISAASMMGGSGVFSSATGNDGNDNAESKETPVKQQQQKRQSPEKTSAKEGSEAVVAAAAASEDGLRQRKTTSAAASTASAPAASKGIDNNPLSKLDLPKPPVADPLNQPLRATNTHVLLLAAIIGVLIPILIFYFMKQASPAHEQGDGPQAPGSGAGGFAAPAAGGGGAGGFGAN
jgi:hypothetical protein